MADETNVVRTFGVVEDKMSGRVAELRATLDSLARQMTELRADGVDVNFSIKQHTGVYMVGHDGTGEQWVPGALIQKVLVL
jgi:hypothetical protein